MSRLLVVEDEPLVAMDLRQRLMGLGYDIVGVAPTGERAIALADRLHPDLVLMDVHLQGAMDGVTAAAEIRQHQDVPIVFVTARVDEATVARASHIHPSGYIVKPFEEQTLRTVVARSLERRHTGIPAGEVSPAGVSQANREATGQQLLQKLDSFGAFIARHAHDLNNVFSSIIGYAQIAQLDEAADDRLKQLTSEILAAGERGSELMRRLVRSAGRGGGAVAPISLSDFVPEATRTFPAAPKEINLRLELAPDLPTVHGDPAQLEEVLCHLVQNAVDAIGTSAGDITIATGIQHVDTSFLSTCLLHADRSPGDYAWLEVRDTGSGIASEILDSIFDPFFSTRPGKRGLGLALVAAMMRSHHGLIRVQSQPGEGAVFTLYFPVPMLSPRHVTPDTLDDWTPRGNVLIVDDDASLRTMARSLLEAMGMNVYVAEHGPEALEFLQSTPTVIDVFLLDVTMPYMNGPTLFRKIRAMLPTAKVIMISGFGADIGVAELRQEGLVDFLKKPFTSQQLKAVLHRAMTAR
jgi:CheY-like chemotaxis protein/nitrogen-specific signal transduction histidine kinase